MPVSRTSSSRSQASGYSVLVTARIRPRASVVAVRVGPSSDRASTTVRSRNERGKGYRRIDLEAAWAAYVPRDDADSQGTPLHRDPSAVERDSVTTANSTTIPKFRERDRIKPVAEHSR